MYVCSVSSCLPPPYLRPSTTQILLRMPHLHPRLRRLHNPDSTYHCHTRRQDDPGTVDGWVRPFLLTLDLSSLSQYNLRSATSNETISVGSTNLTAALNSFFPALTPADDAAYLKQYPLSDYAGNASVQTRVGTGESELRCAVGPLPSSYC